MNTETYKLSISSIKALKGERDSQINRSPKLNIIQKRCSIEKRKKEWHKIMNKYKNPRNGSIHLYNPKKEGLGPYDINYMNACKKNKSSRNQAITLVQERHVA